MILQTEQRTDSVAPAGTPPRAAAEGGLRLFQTMDELRARHGGAAGTKQRMIRLVTALFAGSLLFGALYFVILFSE